jgi:hypothetical protein
MAMHASLTAALLAQGPSVDRAAELHLYGRFVGSWEMDSVIHDEAGGIQQGPRGEIHFGWALEGRAILDVWILPDVFYGSTLRVYDPALDAWHILWSDPLRQFYARQIGRAEGDDIVQIGDDGKGTPLRWRFTDITTRSFHWIGERAPDTGSNWQMQIEFFARRKT